MKVLKEAGEICSMLISREDLFSELSPSTNGLSTRRFTSVRKRIAKGTSKVCVLMQGGGLDRMLSVCIATLLNSNSHSLLELSTIV